MYTERYYLTITSSQKIASRLSNISGNKYEFIHCVSVLKFVLLFSATDAIHDNISIIDLLKSVFDIFAVSQNIVRNR